MQLNIDEIILEYLVFTATEEIISDYGRRAKASGNANDQSKADMLLQLVDAFVVMFHHMHPDEHGTLELRFRLQLLRFAVVFTRRTSPREKMPSVSAVQVLRKDRRKQASTFRRSGEFLTEFNLPDLATYLPSQDPVKIRIERTCQDKISNSLGLKNAQELIPPPISLLDTLPLFMVLSASQNAMQETTITKMWMQLAAGYMAQAVIEQYLIYGSQSPEVLREAFAWGFDAECGADEGSEEWQINAMFWDEDGAVPEWDSIRDEHIQALVPPQDIDLQEHLQILTAGDLSIFEFEQHILEFLTKIHQGQPKPLLAQVESGEVEGLSKREVRRLHEAVGLT